MEIFGDLKDLCVCVCVCVIGLRYLLMSEHDASPSCGQHSARYSPVAVYTTRYSLVATYISRGAGSSIVRILCLSHYVPTYYSATADLHGISYIYLFHPPANIRNDGLSAP